MQKPKPTATALTTAVPGQIKRQKGELKESKANNKAALANLSKLVLESHNDVLRAAAVLLLSVVHAGRQLLAAKELGPHGGFTAWVEESFGKQISLRTAQRYMSVARFTAAHMPQLRKWLQEQSPELSVNECNDDEVLARLSLAKVVELMKSGGVEKKLTQSAAIAANLFSDLFVEALLGFLGNPALILSTLPLGEAELEVQEIATGKDPVAGRTEWANTLLAIFTNKATAEPACAAVLRAFEQNQVREALVLLPTAFLVGNPLIGCPQLIFRNSHPFAAEASKVAATPMSLLLVSEESRTADFASAFSGFGIVKVAFK